MNSDTHRMMQMITGYWVTQIVHVAATFSLADHLALEIHVGRVTFFVMIPRTLPASEFHSTWSPRLNDFFIQTQLFSNPARALPRTRWQ